MRMKSANNINKYKNTFKTPMYYSFFKLFFTGKDTKNYIISFDIMTNEKLGPNQEIKRAAV